MILYTCFVRSCPYSEKIAPIPDQELVMIRRLLNNLRPSVRQSRRDEQARQEIIAKRRTLEEEERRRIFDTPQSSLDFLIQKFRGRTLVDGAIFLPRLDLCFPTGPMGTETDVVLSYGELIQSAAHALGRSSDEIDRISIGGYAEGLSVFASGKRLFVVGDAFVIGDEPIRGDHSECAMCAYWIAQTITGRTYDRNDKMLEPLRYVGTTRAEIIRNNGEWTISYDLGW